MSVENGGGRIEKSEKRKLQRIHIRWVGWVWRLLTDEEYDNFNHNSGDIAYGVESSMLRNSKGEGEAAKINRRWLGNRD